MYINQWPDNDIHTYLKRKRWKQNQFTVQPKRNFDGNKVVMMVPTQFTVGFWNQLNLHIRNKLEEKNYVPVAPVPCELRFESGVGVPPDENRRPT